MDEQGDVQRIDLLSGRGHGCLYSEVHNQLLTFARRPGRFIHILDLSGRQEAIEIASDDARHFYGHGCFNQSGTRLFATENDYDAARGVIGIYDATNHYKRVAEFSSFGVGPHDMRLLPDGVTLLVANGGIETHPDTDREKLNLLDMQSNLAFIDSRNGRLIKTLDISDQFHQLSLRHLAIGDAGECYIAGQYQGAAEDMPPLVGTVTTSGALEMWAIPREYLVQLKNYISSVYAIPNTSFVAISSSRGGVVLVWDTEKNRIESMSEIRDVSGIAAVGMTLHMSDGAGGMYAFQESGVSSLAGMNSASTLQWDNHLMTFVR